MHSHFYFRVMEYVSDFTSVVPPVLLAAVIYVLVRRLWLNKRGLSRNGWGNEAARLLLVCWLAGLLALVWTPGNFWIKLQNCLFHGIPLELGEWFCTGGFSFSVSFPGLVAGALSGGSWQVLGNVLLYVPLGLLLPLVWKSAGWGRTAAVGLALSLVTELVQPVVGRSFDVDDVIANALGTLMVFRLFPLVRVLAPNAVERCRSAKKNTPAE